MTRLDIIQKKIYDKESLQKQIMIWRLREKKIVFTNGCFDIIHYGHIHYLSRASDLGEILIVAVNADDSVRKLNKGSNRPIQDENSRAAIIASLGFVSAVIIFREETPYEIIKTIKPDILVKGGDWAPGQIVGYDIVKENGGEVISLDFVDGFSTTGIEKKILGE